MVAVVLCCWEMVLMAVVSEFVNGLCCTEICNVVVVQTVKCVAVGAAG